MWALNSFYRQKLLTRLMFHSLRYSLRFYFSGNIPFYYSLFFLGGEHVIEELEMSPMVFERLED